MSADGLRRAWIDGLALVLPLFVVVELNYPFLAPQTELALFALGGLALAFLGGGPRSSSARAWLDLGLAFAATLCTVYVAVHSEPVFRRLWWSGQSLGDRAGIENGVDLAVGAVGLALVLEAARRTVGWALPVLSSVFLLYAVAGSSLPDWAMPHRGYPLDRVVAQTFLHGQGVFGVALSVMFSYVFLFVVFGALLETTGATAFVLSAARRVLGGSAGGPAKVAVLSSGLLGSISGSAVANTATTGTFTIPLMRSSGFSRRIAAGVEAAASSGGALMPPVMGAGAYMMLEIIDPPVTYLQIVKAAIIPACLYYAALFLAVDFYARGLPPGAAEAGRDEAGDRAQVGLWEGALFGAALGALVGLLIAGFSVFRSVTGALLLVAVLSMLSPRTRLSRERLRVTLAKAAASSAPLVAAAASVGVLLGVVTLTGVGTRLPSLILPLAQDHLFAALLVLMASAIVLGMGLPSAVCYLLLATLVGPVLGRLGVVPLAAHLFIFYFGLMSMVTPPVALAAYTASSIAGSRFLASSWDAFRFASVGFVLPFLFVYRPELLLLAPDGGVAPALAAIRAAVVALVGIVPLAAAVGGWLRARLGVARRLVLLAASAALLTPLDDGAVLIAARLGGVVVTVAVAWLPSRRRRSGRGSLAA